MMTQWAECDEEKSGSTEHTVGRLTQTTGPGSLLEQVAQVFGSEGTIGSYALSDLVHEYSMSPPKLSGSMGIGPR